MDEQWFAEQPVEPDAESRPRVTWEDVWGGLGAAKASSGNLALAFEDIDADEWGFAVGSPPPADEDSARDPVPVDLAGEDRSPDDWDIPALASFDAIIDQSPTHDEDAGRGGYEPAGDLGGFDLDDEPSGPLAFTSPSAPPAWRQTLDEAEPDSPPVASSMPATDASSARAQAAPAPAPAPVSPPAAAAEPLAAAAAAAAAAPSMAAAMGSAMGSATGSQGWSPPATGTHRSVDEIFSDDLFDDEGEDDEEDEEPRGEALDPFAGMIVLPERWAYSSRRRIARPRSRQGRTARPARRERRRRGRSPFEEVPVDPGRASGDRAPAGRDRIRRRGRHRHTATEARDDAPRRGRRLRASIVRVLGVSVPIAAAVVVYLRLS